MIETVAADVNDVAKRKQRAAEKKKEAAPNDVATPRDDDDINSTEWKEKQTEISFKKFLEENKWVHDAFDDAIQFAKDNKPRDTSLLMKDKHDDSMQSTPLLDAFVENVLPALKNRGWQERKDTERRSWISGTKKEVS